MVCWVDRGVRNHKDERIEVGRWGSRREYLPASTPRTSLSRGSAAAHGEMGLVSGGNKSQFNSAPHTIAGSV